MKLSIAHKLQIKSPNFSLRTRTQFLSISKCTGICRMMCRTKVQPPISWTTKNTGFQPPQRVKIRNI
eukprot:02120.XXX_26999_27199_1 [CDS] Oithona nana genome sequencing.